MSISTSSNQSVSRTSSTPSAPAPSDALSRNRKTFKAYETVFANLDHPKFTEYAGKFAEWLRNERGYYPEARKEILKLLMIMQRALRRAVGAPESQKVDFPPHLYQHHPMSGPYQKLVRTIYPHSHLFTEETFFVLLRGLFTSVQLPYPRDAQSPANQTTATSIPSESQPPQGLVPPKHPVPDAATTSTQMAPTAVPPHTISAPLIPKTESTQPHGVIQGNMSTNGAGNPPLKVAVHSPSDQHEPAISAASTSKRVLNGEGETSPTKTKKKRKKKALDIDSLAEMDLKNYIAKKEQAQGLLSPQLAPESTATTDVPQPLTSGAVQAQVQAHVPSGPAQEDIKSEVIPQGDVSREVITIPDSPQLQPAAQEVQAPVVVKTEPSDDVIVPSTSFVTTFVDDKEVIDLTSDTEDAMDVDGGSLAIEPETGDTAAPNGVPPKKEQDVISKAQDNPQMDIQPNPESRPEDPENQGTSPEAPVTNAPTKEDDSAVVTGSAGDSDPIASVSPDVNGSIPQDIPPSPPLRTIAVVGQASAFTKAQLRTKEDDSGDFQMDDPDYSDEESSEDPVPAVLSPISGTRLYGPGMKVVAHERGLSHRGCIRFSFHVNEDDYALIERWRRQDDPIPQLRRSLCLSLACYPASQVDQDDAGLEAVIASLASSWPGDGGLSLKVPYQSKIEAISLSPPLLMTPDSTVDVSIFTKAGDNEIEVQHHRNWSEHVFVLLAHHPTEMQIQKVQRKRDEDAEWQSWLKEMTQPLKLDLSFPMPVSVV